MSDHQTDDLFDLIKSMSRTEKRYFKLDAQKVSGNKSNSYLKLFDALNSMDEYEEGRLVKKLKGEPLLNRLTTEKHYLYHNILKSMRSYWSDKSVYSRIKDMILNANYLLDRGLYEQSEKMLRKGKKLAKEYDLSLAILELNELERIVTTNIKRKSYTENISKLVYEKNEVWKSLEQELLFSDYKFNLFSELVKNAQVLDETRKDELRRNYDFNQDPSDSVSSLKGQYHFLVCQAYYHKLLGNSEETFNAYTELMKWWDLNKHLQEEEYSKYITDLANFIGVCIINQRDEIVPELFEKIEKIKPTSFHEEINIFKGLTLRKLLYYFNMGELEKAKEMIPEIESGLKRFNLDKQLLTTIHGNFAILFFLLEDFTSCIKWIQKIIRNKNVQERQDVQRFMRVIKAICYFELDDIENFDSSCRALYEMV